MSVVHFDSQFQSIPFYKHHPYMIPFVGEDYDSPKHKKLLLIGESHYLPKGSTVHYDANAWYNRTPSLSKDEEDYCNTAILAERENGKAGALEKRLTVV